MSFQSMGMRIFLWLTFQASPFKTDHFYSRRSGASCFLCPSPCVCVKIRTPEKMRRKAVPFCLPCINNPQTGTLKEHGSHQIKQTPAAFARVARGSSTFNDPPKNWSVSLSFLFLPPHKRDHPRLRWQARAPVVRHGLPAAAADVPPRLRSKDEVVGSPPLGNLCFFSGKRERAVGRLGVARMVRLGIAQMDRSGIAFCRRLVAHACVLICLLAMYVYIRACASMYALVCACRRVYRMTYVTCMFHDICPCMWLCACVLTCMPCGVCPRTR